MSEDIDITGLLTTAQAARRADCSPSAIRHAIARGRLRAKKVFGYWWLSAAAVDRYRQTRASGAPLCILLTPQYVRLYEVLQQTLGATGELVLQRALMSLAYDEGLSATLWHAQPCGCAECQAS